MFKNYFKIVYRNLTRFKVYPLINIFGLSIGMSCCILILLYIKDELSYDKFHMHSDRIFRIVEMKFDNGKTDYWHHTPAPLAPALKNECPEILNAARLGIHREIITYNSIVTKNIRLLLTDPSLFDIFTIPLIKGDSRYALNDLNSIVISENLAEKYFGKNDPVGKILQIGRENYQRDYKVTGVFKNLPHNSTLQFDCASSFQNNYIAGNEGNVSWRAQNYETFVLLSENSSMKLLEKKLQHIVEKYKTENESAKMKYLLQSLTSVHVNMEPGYELPTDSDSAHIYIFAGIALIILLIACINFINLSTARASMREKEIGIRKIVGANRLQLIKQLLGESVILALLATIISIPIVETLLPVFNRYAGKELIFLHQNNTLFLFGLFVFALIIGVLAGSYPALFISSFKPLSILNGRFFNYKANTKIGLRRLLVIIQFIIAIFFIVCTVVMHNQLHFLKDKNLGYEKNNLVVIPIDNQNIKPKYELYKTEILRNIGILSATATSFLPSEQGYNQNISLKPRYEGSISHIDWITVDYDFIKTLGLKFTSGRNFSEELSSDTASAYILNESAVKKIGLKNPLGEQMNIIGWGPVIGVIKDFNFKSLHHQIKPMALCIYPDGYKYLLVRIQPENLFGSIQFLENQWKELFPNTVFEYSFFNKDFDKLYKSEINLGNIFNFITILALLVACLGLFGLSHFSTQQRIKEIGIRKVVGASLMNILIMITKDFTKWILVANIIAWPTAYYFMNKWLQDYAYHINISWWMFILAGGIVLVVSVLTVSWQSAKAALANPVESLKYE